MWHPIQTTSIDFDKHVMFPKQFVLSYFDSDELEEVSHISQKYKFLIDTAKPLTSCFRKYNSVKCSNKSYHASKHSRKPILYYAKDGNSDIWPVVVQYFFMHKFCINDKVYSNYMACVKWLKSRAWRHDWGKPIEVWYNSEFDSNEHHRMFIFVENLKNYSAYQTITWTI